MSEANTSGTVSEANTSGTVSEANTSGIVSEANTFGTVTGEQQREQDTVIKVLKGNLDEVELAALIAVLTAAALAAPAGTPAASRPAETWGAPTLMHRGTPPFSPYSYPSLSHLRG